MGRRMGFYEDDEDYSDEPAAIDSRLRRTAARHRYRLQKRGEDYRFVDPDTGAAGVALSLDEVAYNLQEFRSGELMNGGRDLVSNPERL